MIKRKNSVVLCGLLLILCLMTACGKSNPQETSFSTSKAAAETTAPETTSAPETTAPETTSAAETTAPETTPAPETMAPETTPTAETTAPETTPAPETSAPETSQHPEDPAEACLDYDKAENWAYFDMGQDKEVDVFLICPTVDTRSETNSFDLNEKLKGRFITALDMEKGIYEETGRLFSPYYRQMSIKAYKLPADEYEKAKQVAYADISAAFRWYLDHENNGRGLILAGFSQGAEMCLELLKEYYGGDSAEAKALRDRLITVYAIGWTVTKDMTDQFPQIVPATGEKDTGSVVSFDCENGTLTETIIIPAGITALSINPLNWKTDSTAADKSLNLGAVMSTGAEAVPEMCGAYLGSRGELVVTDVNTADYPPGLDIFPEGAFHLYDYMFFFNNLKQNIADRTEAWKAAQSAAN